MVAGDIVNGVFDAVTVSNFRPAATVEIAITSGYVNPLELQLTDGIINSMIAYTSAGSDRMGGSIMINNTIWLKGSTFSGNGSSFSGIQIK